MPEISSTSITEAWQRAITIASQSPRKEVANLILTVNCLAESPPLHDATVLTQLDAALLSNDNYSVGTVSNTIFPSSLWRNGMSRHSFYDRYLRLWPRIAGFKANKRGTYFQRLISFPGSSGASFNQLEHVITAYNAGIRRRSALQCGILAPDLDLNATPFQGFPCMQQVAFIPEQGSGLRITALYPMHYLWARAYGNYTGLINLGRFMATQMNLTLTSLSCVSLVAKLDEPVLAKPFLLGGASEV